MDELKVRADCDTGELQAVIDASGPWFHSFVFSNGVRTAGADPSAAKLAALQLPDLRGKSVLDVGAYDGYFSFQAERLGAARVVACDEPMWVAEPVVFERFGRLRTALGSKVEDVTVPVPGIDPALIGKFDVVLFLGVLYHAPNMIGYLRRVKSVTSGVLVLETLVDALDIAGPMARMYPPGSLNGDASNWWGPNIACVELMLQRLHFTRVEFKGLWHLNTVAQIRGVPHDGPLTSGRAVWHAYV